MSLKKHVEFVQAKGAQGGMSLPIAILKDAIARYYYEDLETTTPIDLVLNTATGFLKISAIGGGVMLRANLNASKTEATKATATLTLPTPSIVPSVHAQSMLTGNTIIDGDEVTIGDRTYRFKNSLEQENDVLIGSDDSASIGNLKYALNGTGTEGVDYADGTLPHADVVGHTFNLATLVVVARTPGPWSNDLDTTSSGVSLAWDDITLGGGTGSSVAGVTGDKVSIRAEEYEFVTALSESHGNADAVPNQVLRGSGHEEALDNLKSAVNGTSGEATLYSTGTEQPDDVLATTNDNTYQIFEAQTLGASGNAYTVSASEMSDGTFGVGVTTFTGGGEGSNFDIYIHAGQTIELGVDDSVQAISMIAVGSNTDVAVVEY